MAAAAGCAVQNGSVGVERTSRSVSEKPIANSISGPQRQDDERREDEDVGQARCPLLGIHHALLAEPEAEQRAGALGEAIEPVLALHGQEDRGAAVDDVDEDGEPDEDQQGGDDRIHGNLTRESTYGRVARSGNAGD